MGLPEPSAEGQASGLQAMDVVLGVGPDRQPGGRDVAEAAHSRMGSGLGGIRAADSPFSGARKHLQQRLDVLRGPAGGAHFSSGPGIPGHQAPSSLHHSRAGVGGGMPGEPGSPRANSASLFGASSYSAFLEALPGGSGSGGGSGGEVAPARLKYPTSAAAGSPPGQLDLMLSSMAGIVGLRPAKVQEHGV